MKLVRCRICETCTMGRISDHRCRTFKAGDEYYLYQGEDDATLWWTCSDLDWAYLLPAKVVQPLEEAR